MAISNRLIPLIIESEAGGTKTVYIDKEKHHEYALSTEPFLLGNGGYRRDPKSRWSIEYILDHGDVVYLKMKGHHSVMSLYEIAGKIFSLSTKSFLLKHGGKYLNPKSTTSIEFILKDGDVVQLEMESLMEDEYGEYYDDNEYISRSRFLHGIQDLKYYPAPAAAPEEIEVVPIAEQPIPSILISPPTPPPEEPECREITKL